MSFPRSDVSRRLLRFPSRFAVVACASLLASGTSAQVVVLPTNGVALPGNDPVAIVADADGIVAAGNPTVLPIVSIADGNAEALAFDPAVVTTIVAPSPFTGFGFGIARDAGLVAVGEPFYFGAPNSAGPRGAVRLYERGPEGTYVETALIEGPEVAGFFGGAVALSKDRLFVAAPFADVGSVENAGVVHVFERGDRGWALITTLQAPVPSFHARFGQSVAADGSRLAVGAPGTDVGNVESAGVIHVMHIGDDGGVTHEAAITSPLPLPLDELGKSLSLFDGLIVGGMPTSGHVGPNRGAATVATRDGRGTWMSTLLLPDADAPAVLFGSHVLAGNESVLVSTADGSPLGWARRFHRSRGVWIADSTPWLRGPVAAWGRRVAAPADSSHYSVDVFPIDMTCPTPISGNDCDENSLADDCEIAYGNVEDRDDDGRPDGCPDARIAVELPSFDFSAALQAPIAASASRVALRPIAQGPGSAVEASCFQWADIAWMGEGWAALELPVPCGSYLASQLITMQDSWLATATIESWPLAQVNVLEQTEGEPPTARVTLPAEANGTALGVGLASTESLLVVPAPLAPNPGILRRLQRGDDGSWTELSPIELPAPGPDTGYAIGLSACDDGTHVLAVADATPADDVFELGRVRIFRLAPSGAVTEEATLRLPRWNLSARRYGAHVVADGDRVVITWTSAFSNVIGGVLVHRRTQGGTWLLEAELSVANAPANAAKARSIAATSSNIALAVAGDGIQRFLRHANGVWIEQAGVACEVQNWRFAASVAFLGDRRLAVLAWTSGNSQPVSGELWALDPFDDCNANGLNDREEIANGAVDANGNGVLDLCEPAGDLDFDGVVGPTDLGMLLGRWGAGPGLGDLTDDGSVDSADLAALLATWSRR